MKKSVLILLFLLGMNPFLPGRGDAETRTVSWNAVTTYIDGTPIESTKTVTYVIFWTQDAGLGSASLRTIVSSTSQTSATFDPDVQGMTRGQTIYFTGATMLSTGEQSTLAPAYSWTVPPVSLPPGPPTLTGLTISGPASVNESSIGTYAATAMWSDNSTTAVTPTWSVSPTTYASINASGVLTTLAVTANQTVTITASYTSGGVTRAAARAVTIVNVPPTLSDLSISGPASVNESSSGTYAATAMWSDNSTTAVAPAWSVSPTTYASINASGVLTTLAVTANQTVTITASYTSGGVIRTATQALTIVNVSAVTLNPPQNVAVTGPVATSPTRIFRLSWDPVSSYADGTPIPSGSARYTAYWTTDPSLSSGTLRPLASSIAGTSVEFDPAAAGMVTDQRVYFTAIVTTSAGGQSPMAEGVSWVVLNPGPAAPTGGTIIRR